MVYVDELFLINNYKFEIGFFTVSDNPILNDIALDQIDMFFSMLMSNAIIVDKKDYDESNFIKEMKNNKFMTAGKGSDQLVGSLVYLKLVNIVGENLDIDHITITSELGKDVCYAIGADSLEIEALVPKKETWWNDDNTKHQAWWNRPDADTYDKIVDDKLYEGDFSWRDIFKDEFEEAENFDKPTKTTVFKLIPGGKDVH